MSGGWNSQDNSGSSNLKALERPFSYPVASEGPVELRTEIGSNCQLTE